MTHQPKKQVFRRWRLSIAFLLSIATAGCSSCGGWDTAGGKPPAGVPPQSILDATFVSNNDTISSNRRKLIAIHGFGDSPENFSDLFTGAGLTSTVILPRAPTAHGRGGSWFPVAIPVKSTSEKKLRLDVTKAAERLCQYIGAYRFKRAPVVTGFSQGGILSFAVAVTCPEEIAAAVPVAGFLPLEIPGNSRTPPIIAFHGTADRVINFDWGNQSVEKLKKANVAAKMHRFDNIGHTITPNMHQQWIAVLKQYLE